MWEEREETFRKITASDEKIAILIDSFRSCMQRLQQTNLSLKCANIFCQNFFPAVFNVCLPFLLKNWRDSNILMIVSILFTTSAQRKKRNKTVRTNWRMCIFFMSNTKRGKMAKKTDWEYWKAAFIQEMKKRCEVYFEIAHGDFSVCFLLSVWNLCCVSFSFVL